VRALARGTAFVLLGALIGALGSPLAMTLAAFSAQTATPGNTFSALEVEPATVTSLTPQGGGVVRLSWSASPTASTETVSYRVLRRPTGGAFSQIATVSGPPLTYDDTPGDGSWDYAVRTAVATFTRDSSVWSITIDLTPPTAASDVVAVTGTTNGSVDLTWTAATDATSGVSGYAIRYVQANTCPAASSAAYPSTMNVGAVTAATVSGLTRNRQYCFYLLAQDGMGNQSGASNVAGAKAK
jgi:hypothetical protein